MNNKAYDTLKWVALIALPALAVFISQISPALDFQYAKQAVDIITATGLFIGALIGVSTYHYNKNNDDNENDSQKGEK